MTTMPSSDAPAGGKAGARRSLCPVACALDVVGDRWTLLVIRDLFGGKRRYGDFLASAEKIPTNILADRLKRLEREGLIARVPYSTRPPRVEYHLTPEGRELGRAVDALATWGLNHCPGTVRTIWPSTNPGEAHAEATN
jgi:DNA-binding HxlR family transcriptional regulator